MYLRQINAQPICRSHRRNPGRIFKPAEITYRGACPWLYHTLYPYFLAALAVQHVVPPGSKTFGRELSYGDTGDCHVGCPAAGLYGIDCFVCRRVNDGSYGVGENVKQVIYAEVVAARGCPYKHAQGDKILFTNIMKDSYMCPAAWHSLIPLKPDALPECLIDAPYRCPDWKDTVRFEFAKCSGDCQKCLAE